jgi:Tfp pilus assembly protein PilO
MAIQQLSFQRYGKFYRNAKKYALRKEVLISSYIILSLFTVSFFAAVFIRPTAVKIAMLWREIQDKRSVYTQLEKKIRDLEKAQELLTSVEEKLEDVQKAIPEEALLQKFMQIIEYLASAYGLTINSGSYPPSKLYSSKENQSAKDLTTYPFDVRLTGDTDQFQAFILSLEELDRYVKINKIKLSPLEKSQQKKEFTLSLLLESDIYSYNIGEGSN